LLAWLLVNWRVGVKWIGFSKSEQGKVFGSHFAFSHLWWAIAYPIAGFAGSRFPGNDFLYGV
jgi:hypothetical protein